MSITPTGEETYETRLDNVRILDAWSFYRRTSQQIRLELRKAAAADREGQTIFIGDAHCRDENRFVVRSDEKLRRFLSSKDSQGNQAGVAELGPLAGLGIQVVYPLTDEPWGVRRFFVTDPNRVVINV